MMFNHELVKHLRQKSHLTLRIVAHKSGINKDVFNNIEKGKVTPHFETVEKIANFFGVPKEKFYIDLSKEADKFNQKAI